MDISGIKGPRRVLPTWQNHAYNARLKHWHGEGRLTGEGKVSSLDHNTSEEEVYDVGVAIVPLYNSPASRRTNERESGVGEIPGYDDALGRRRPDSTGREGFLIERGEEAVRVATTAIVGQIGLATRRIAAALGEQIAPPSAPESFGLESVDISFGITLTAGVQAMFTAQAESSVQVTVTLSRNLGGTDPDTS
jgi:hypothetical protein